MRHDQVGQGTPSHRGDLGLKRPKSRKFRIGPIGEVLDRRLLLSTISASPIPMPSATPSAIVAGSDGMSSTAVGMPSPTLTGWLAPGSDSGPSSSDNITNVNRPVFQGKATPFSVVQLFAQAGNTNPTVLRTLGQTIAGPDGGWSLPVGTLADGAYAITASMVSPAGSPSVPIALMSSPLIIDTSGPRVSAFGFDAATGLITVVIQDAWSGLDQASAANPANYTLVGPNSLRGRHATPTSNPGISGFYTDAQAETIQLGSGTVLAPGRYLLKVASGGITDRAGNPLDGEFSGRFPSGDGVPGGNFEVRIIVGRPHPTHRHMPRPAKHHAR